MRLIDIYYANYNYDTGFRLIAQDLIQAEENVLSRSRNAKTFVMADGSLLMYPAEKDKVQMTLKLECTEEQADLLGDAEHYGKLYFAGIHAGAKKTGTPTDSNYGVTKAFSGYLTGNSRTEQIASDLYKLELPLQLDFSDVPTVPVIQTVFDIQEGFKIHDTIQKFNQFIYLKDGIFHRKQVIFTSDAQISLAFPVTLADFNVSDLTGSIKQNSSLVKIWSDLTYNSYCETTLDLLSGMNSFEILVKDSRVSGHTSKPMKIRFQVYKFP